MRNIAVIGTGYVGLVTGVCLSTIGHYVTCIDIDQEKINKLSNGIPIIFEPSLEQLMEKSMKEGRLKFTADYETGLKDIDIIYIAVGTPQKDNGTVDLQYIEEVSRQIALHLTGDTIVVTKSTVPVGTNDYIKNLINRVKQKDFHVEIVSNPEFLREGSAVEDTFNSDRIVIGAENEQARLAVEEIYKPFNLPIFHTDIRSAEMLKYAANAFLATKISFINEIASICEKVGANIEDVAKGIGQDSRIGPHFLQAGIGYGGSCFPKDTKALCHLAGSINHPFHLLKSVIDVNQKQQLLLVNKAISRFGSLKNKRCTILGLAFKPNTDDIRESASIVIVNELIKNGAKVVAYDPIAMNNAKKVLPNAVHFAKNMEEALKGAEIVFILTEWREFLEFPLEDFVNLMENPIIFDGRNCFSLETMKAYPIEYHSVGRKSVC